MFHYIAAVCWRKVEAWPYIAQHVAMATEKPEGVSFACLAVLALFAILHNSVDAQEGKLGSIITKPLFRQMI